MRNLIKNSLINSLGLFLLSQIFSGLTIVGGVQTIILAGFILTLFSIFLSPILTIITFPLNFLTFGSFSFLIQVILFYLLTVVIPQIHIGTLIFGGANMAGFIIPKMTFAGFMSYVVASVVFGIIVSFIQWLIKK